MGLKEVKILGDAINTHWYYVSKGRALRQFLGELRVPEVLDVGAGPGIFSRQLLAAGLCDSAVCVDPHYTQESCETHIGKPIRFVKTVPNVNQRLILMMDVLEHVDDDVGLLKEYSGPMHSGGHVLITVPAFGFLWSGHDVFLEHRRRYTASMAEASARKAGLEIVKTRYFFATLFPLVAAIRLLKRRLLENRVIAAKSELALYADWLNSLLTRIHDIERLTLFPSNKLAGLSVFCLCRKP